MDATAAGATEASGKAIAETAKLGGKLVDATMGAGGYLARVVGTIPEDVLGLGGGDWLHEQRRRNLAGMQAKTAAILQREGAAVIGNPSPSVVVPLLQAAVDEGREELQDLWAALLAQAMKGERRVRRQFFEVLRQMEPADALVLAEIGRLGNGTRAGYFEAVKAASLHGIGATEFTLAVTALSELACLENSPIVRLTPFGKELLRVCGLEVHDARLGQGAMPSDEP